MAQEAIKENLPYPSIEKLRAMRLGIGEISEMVEALAQRGFKLHEPQEGETLPATNDVTIVFSRKLEGEDGGHPTFDDTMVYIWRWPTNTNFGYRIRQTYKEHGDTDIRQGVFHEVSLAGTLAEVRAMLQQDLEKCDKRPRPASFGSSVADIIAAVKRAVRLGSSR